MKRFKNILFVADSEYNNNDSFERAVELATNNQAQLTIVSILEELPTHDSLDGYGLTIDELHNSIKNQYKTHLKTLIGSSKHKIPITSKVLTGVAFIVLIQEVLNNQFDLLIKTAEEEGIIESLFGSSDMHLLRKCPCPVWLIKSSKQSHYQRIMVAIDFAPYDIQPKNEKLNQQLLEMSSVLALSDFSELHILHVWDAYGESVMRSGFGYQPIAYVKNYVENMRIKHALFLDILLDQLAASRDMKTKQSLKPKVHLIKGKAKDMIPKMVKKEKIDLMMMGTVGRTGIPGFIMGNTAETVLNRIDCSVLAIKPDGFITPITVER
jgi:universal stress protein E